MTGDLTLHPESRVLVMTTEILRNTLFEDPQHLADVGCVVFDEIHFLDDIERGSVWEEALLFLPEATTVVGLSATIANLGQFATWMERARKRKVAVVEERKRPVPLKHYLYHPKAGIFPPSRLKPVSSRFAKNKRNRSWQRRDDRPLFDEILGDGNLPILCFCFSRRLCERKAQKEGKHRNLLNKKERQEVVEVWRQSAEEFKFDTQHGPLTELRDSTLRGVACHHAGMLPLHKEMVERLFTRGLLKLLFTTETFALGINMPARTVVFDSITKFDGIDFDYLRTRDYLQMAGRAGRLGMDQEGLVYSVLEFDDVLEAPIHRILDGKVEAVTSRFNLDYSTLVHLYGAAGEEKAFETWERSFAAFQAREHSKKREERNRKRMRGLVGKRLEFLRTLGYIGEDRTIKARGRAAVRLHGLEIPLTELLFEGVLADADPPSLAGLVAAVVHESRRREEFWRNALRPMRGLLRRAQAAIERAQKTETDCGLAPTVRSIDEAMVPAIWEYANGRPFEELGKFTSAAPGDFVRTTRMVVQYLRHLAIVAKEGADENLASTCGDAVACLWRGPVDVRRELGLREEETPV